MVVEVGTKGAGVDLREALHGEAGLGEGSQSGCETKWCLGSALLLYPNHGSFAYAEGRSFFMLSVFIDPLDPSRKRSTGKT